MSDVAPAKRFWFPLLGAAGSAVTGLIVIALLANEAQTGDPIAPAAVLGAAIGTSLGIGLVLIVGRRSGPGSPSRTAAPATIVGVALVLAIGRLSVNVQVLIVSLAASVLVGLLLTAWVVDRVRAIRARRGLRRVKTSDGLDPTKRGLRERQTPP